VTTRGQDLPRGIKMGDGFWRGKSFEGCSRRRGRQVSRTPQGNLKGARNSTDPRVGSGVQQTRKATCGESHQDGEKP
jgi:hypothetical protein